MSSAENMASSSDLSRLWYAMGNGCLTAEGTVTFGPVQPAFLPKIRAGQTLHLAVWLRIWPVRKGSMELYANECLYFRCKW